MPDWKAGDGVSRMLAAVMAANDNKVSIHFPRILLSLSLPLLMPIYSAYTKQVDCNKVASLLDSTYNSVEKRLRSFKQEATQLIQKAKDGGRLDKDGGVIKAVSATPTKTTTTAKKSALNGTPVVLVRNMLPILTQCRRCHRPCHEEALQCKEIQGQGRAVEISKPNSVRPSVAFRRQGRSFARSWTVLGFQPARCSRCRSR